MRIWGSVLNNGKKQATWGPRRCLWESLICPLEPPTWGHPCRAWSLAASSWASLPRPQAWRSPQNAHPLTMVTAAKRVVGQKREYILQSKQEKATVLVSALVWRAVSETDRRTCLWSPQLCNHRGVAGLCSHMTLVISSDHYHIGAHRSYKYTTTEAQVDDN